MKLPPPPPSSPAAHTEGHLRRRVLDLPNVTLVDGTSVHGLEPAPDGMRVAGVRLSDEILTRDLVVVATGRAGQLPVWLDALGFPAPAEEKLTVDIRYASRHFTIPDGYLGRDKLILIGAEPMPTRDGPVRTGGRYLAAHPGRLRHCAQATHRRCRLLGVSCKRGPADVLVAVAAGGPSMTSRPTLSQRAEGAATSDSAGSPWAGRARGRSDQFQPGLRPRHVCRGTPGHRLREALPQVRTAYPGITSRQHAESSTSRGIWRLEATCHSPRSKANDQSLPGYRTPGLNAFSRQPRTMPMSRRPSAVSPTCLLRPACCCSHASYGGWSRIVVESRQIRRRVRVD